LAQSFTTAGCQPASSFTHASVQRRSHRSPERPGGSLAYWNESSRTPPHYSNACSNPQVGRRYGATPRSARSRTGARTYAADRNRLPAPLRHPTQARPPLHGWSANLPIRLAEHAAGHGARLTEVVATTGIGWTLARTWPNVTRAKERTLKNQGGGARRCPLCGIKPRLCQPRPVIALPQWTEYHDGNRTFLGAECESCHHVCGVLAFDLAQPLRRVCLACSETDGGPLPQAR